MRRGEVWLAELPPPIGRRPVVLLSRDQAYRVRAFVTIAPVTTRIRHIKAEVPLGSDEGLRRPSVANLDVLATVPRAGLSRRLGALGRDKVRAMDAAIHFALALEE